MTALVRTTATGLAVAVLLILTVLFLAGAPEAQKASAAGSDEPGPSLELLVAQKTVTVSRWHGVVALDPGIWVGPVGGDLRIDVAHSYRSRRFTATEVIGSSHGREQVRELPSGMLDGWRGLAHFFRFVLTSTGGLVVAKGFATFCPNTSNPERASPSGGVTNPYPQSCSVLDDPFQLGSVWGIRAGWATDAFDLTAHTNDFQLAVGHYTLTATITPQYRRLFHVSRSHATATVRLIVQNGPEPAVASTLTPSPADSWQSASAALISRPPAAALPELIALPAWNITAYRRADRDYMAFAAGIWDRHAPLDIQGFRSDGSSVMRAYQYFWWRGKIVGRMPVGTMGFDSRRGHHHWHFEQFARYLLRRPNGSVAAVDPKVGFCLGPSEAIDLLLPGVSFQPAFHTPTGGCGAPTNLWVDEELPPGWGDTYRAAVAGQSLDITKIPNGRYEIAIIANPLHVLHEVPGSHNTSLRTVILGGNPGHRTIRVPAWHHLDAELIDEH